MEGREGLKWGWGGFGGEGVGGDRVFICRYLKMIKISILDYTPE